MASEEFMVVAKALWKYYEEGLGDTPARVTTVVFHALKEAGYEVTKGAGNGKELSNQGL